MGMNDNEAGDDRLVRIGELLRSEGAVVVGDRVRRLRKQHNLSIRELADVSSLSKTSIVRLEHGRGSHASTVLRICEALGVHVERLSGAFEGGETAGVHRRTDDRWFDLGDMAGRPIGRDRTARTAEDRVELAREGEVPAFVCMLQSRLTDGNVLPSVLEVHAPTAWRSHVGEEFVYVLRGRVVIEIAEERHELDEGESLTFWSSERHRYSPADEGDPVELLSVRVNG